jgi:hypothetical protein
MYGIFLGKLARDILIFYQILMLVQCNVLTVKALFYPNFSYLGQLSIVWCLFPYRTYFHVILPDLGFWMYFHVYLNKYTTITNTQLKYFFCVSFTNNKCCTSSIK